MIPFTDSTSLAARLFEALPVLGGPAPHSPPPEPETGRLQVPSHRADDLGLRQPEPFVDLLERGPVMPRHPDQSIEFPAVKIRRFHLMR